MTESPTRDVVDIVDRLRDVGCDRQPFTPEHAKCICRLTSKAAAEIERLRSELEKAIKTIETPCDFRFLDGPWENSELPTIVRTDPDGGDPFILATLCRVHRPDDLYELCARANRVDLVPEGWQLVPKEPTPEMLTEGVRVAVNQKGEPWCPPCYRAMLASAPSTTGTEAADAG